MTRAHYFVFISLFSLTASAETYFETLKKNFTGARDTITASDFDEIGSKSARVCTQVFFGSQDQENPAHLRKFTITKDAHGPLLPGKQIVLVLMADNSEPDPRGAAESTHTTFSKREVQSVQYLGGDDIRVHRKGNLLIFSRSNQQATTPYSYGYCFSNLRKN